MIDQQQLMRVYGALMWSLGKVLNTPEVARVYIGSFWDQPLRYIQNRKLFEAEEQDLFSDITSLPRNAALRKLNDLIKRARLAKVHAYIISTLRKEMPSMFGKDSKKKDLIKNLSNIYLDIEREFGVPAGDFPDLQEMQEKLINHDFTKFPLLKKSLLDTVDKMLAEDIAKLMAMIPQVSVFHLGFFKTCFFTLYPFCAQEQVDSKEETVITGGAFDGIVDSPFGFKRGEGVDAGSMEPGHIWIVEKDKPKYDEMFERLSPIDGKITGAAAKGEMVKSNLPNLVLSKIWKLSDLDKDGMLDAEEFALAMHLMQIKLDGHDLPQELPRHLIPPNRRK